MVSELLTKAGVEHRHNRFTKPPAGTFAVWLDYIDTDGPDGMPPSIFSHNISIEVYEPKPDDAAEAAIEAAMNERCLQWHKQDRSWIDDEQLYQTVYEFSYIEKRRN
jgi:hypothetical protein